MSVLGKGEDSGEQGYYVGPFLQGIYLTLLRDTYFLAYSS